MADAVFSFFELIGVVAAVGTLAVLAVVATLSLCNSFTMSKPKPMIMEGEYLCYTNRKRIP